MPPDRDVAQSSQAPTAPITLDGLRSLVPEYARDVRLNVSGIATITSLTEQQRWGTVVAAACAARSGIVTRAVVADATSHLSASAMTAARAAAAIMAMNNVYYRCTHALGGDYSELPARLRMAVIANSGVERADFELWCFAVSTINGCTACTVAHERQVVQRGGTREMVQDAVRIAAIIQSLAVVLDAEAAISG